MSQGAEKGFNWKDAISKLAGTDGVAKVTTCDAIVVSVSESDRTCIVNCIDSNKTLDGVVARLMPDISDGELNLPQVDSTVTIIFTSFTEPYVCKFSWLDKKEIIVGNQGWLIEGEKQKLNDGSYDGIPILIDPQDSEKGLVSKINRLENKLNDLAQKYNGLLTSYNAHTHPYVNVSAPAVTSPIVVGYTQTETPISPITQKADIENPNITHGKTLE